MFAYFIDTDKKRLGVFSGKPCDDTINLLGVQEFSEEDIELSEVDNGYYIKGYAPKFTSKEIEEQALAQAKTERSAAVASITVTVDGMVFDGDETAQERMARTVTAATATGASMDDVTTWVLHDNTVATPTIRQLATALRRAGEAQTALWTGPYKRVKKVKKDPQAEVPTGGTGGTGYSVS